MVLKCRESYKNHFSGSTSGRIHSGITSFGPVNTVLILVHIIWASNAFCEVLTYQDINWLSPLQAGVYLSVLFLRSFIKNYFSICIFFSFSMSVVAHCSLRISTCASSSRDCKSRMDACKSASRSPKACLAADRAPSFSLQYLSISECLQYPLFCFSFKSGINLINCPKNNRTKNRVVLLYLTIIWQVWGYSLNSHFYIVMMILLCKILKWNEKGWSFKGIYIFIKTCTVQIAY